jgi:arginase
MIFLEEIVKACAATATRLLELAPEVFPIVLGGDHSIAIGSVAGCSRRERTGLVWVDAHGDFNTPASSPTGNIHGMPLATLCGLGDPRLVDAVWPGRKIDPRDVVLVGVRDLDHEERRTIRAAGVTVYTMKEVDRLGLPRIADETLARLGDLPRLHVSFDADVLDPEIAPGVGTPVPGGLTYREAHLLMELFADSGRVTSLDLVEVNPILDRENTTANTLVGLAASLLGQQIL